MAFGCFQTWREENINRYINKYASDKIISSKLKRNLDVYSKLKKYQKKRRAGIGI